MGLFKRFRPVQAGVAKIGEAPKDTPAQSALRLIDEGNALEREGRPEEAIKRYEAAIRLAPTLARAHLNRGNVLLDLGDTSGALHAYQTALLHEPSHAGAHYNTGNALVRSGRHEEGLAAYRKAISLDPDLADAWVAMACVFDDLGQHDAAVAAYRQALAISPNYAQVHCNLGNALLASGQLEAAAASYQKGLEIDPNLEVAHAKLGDIRHRQGRLDDAVQSYRSAVAIKPDFAVAQFSLGNVLQLLRRYEDSIPPYQSALAIAPDFAEAHSNLGNALARLGRVDDALASYRSAIAASPDYVGAHYNLGNLLKDRGRLAEAVSSYRRALELNPDYVEAHNNAGNALRDLGRLDDALASYRRAVEINPDFDIGYSNALFCLAHNESITAEALFAEHCRYGARVEAPLRASWQPHSNDRDPERCLQIGFVSADFGDHAVASFIEPILSRLGRPGLSMHAYYNHVTEGSVTPRLRGYFQRWHAIADLSDEALAEKIKSDGIDILIDLSGHTAGNRLRCFARKPAPIQMSWIGYPGTTGLTSMDYYLADRHFLPPGQFDSQFTEKLVYLPGGPPFLPSDWAPPVNALPALTNGYVTFGSFNRQSKLTASTIVLWSRLLRALPHARMVLGGLQEDREFGRLADLFGQEGIARERLDFYPRTDIAAYLALHHQVDMCLDTFPYTGGTTTSHALWMGVPTLTIAGDKVAGRQGAAILGHIGLEAFVAENAEDFQKKGLSWARDITSLSLIRAGLRERCEQAPVRNPEQIAVGLDQALRTIWRRWCAGLPAAAIEVGTSSA